VRQQHFLDIWRHSDRMNEVRAIRLKHLTGCSSCVHGASCSRCPGLAFMEGNMRGPSTQDCEKSFVRTGVPSVNLQAKRSVGAGAMPSSLPHSNLIQIRPVTEIAGISA
jgi:hypothetical protein